LITATLVVAPLAGAAGSGAWAHQLGARSKTKPVRAVAPPLKVSLALAKTEAAPVVVLNESSQSGTEKYLVESRAGRAETWQGRKVSLIQIGRMVYAPAPKGGCYESAKRSNALLPNVAGMLLPSGIAALKYSVKGRTISWSIKTTGKFQPHGSVKANASGQIVLATVYSGPGVPLTAVLSYPKQAPKIQAPARVCRT
jgi:hypothetical protein